MKEILLKLFIIIIMLTACSIVTRDCVYYEEEEEMLEIIDKKNIQENRNITVTIFDIIDGYNLNSIIKIDTTFIDTITLSYKDSFDVFINNDDNMHRIILENYITSEYEKIKCQDIEIYLHNDNKKIYITPDALGLKTISFDATITE